MPQKITVPPAEEPKTVENFLKKRFPIGFIRKLFRKKAVRINGKRSAPKETVHPGDRVQLFLPFEKRPSPSPTTTSSASTLDIVFEDDNLLIINKPAGTAVHEGKAIFKRHSILGMLEAAYRPQGVSPKLVHRIDKETSGLLVVAKREDVCEELQKKFAQGNVEKEYQALIVGRLYPKEGLIDLPLPGRLGKPVSARTFYKVEKEFSGTTLVRVRTETGRMHQIRLHFASIGHPVVMDDEHGDFAFNKSFRKANGLKRQFLHAGSIAFEYRGKKLTWIAPLPDDLTQTLERLTPC